MYCPHCKAIIADNSLFCNHCGQSTNTTPAAQPYYAPPVRKPAPPKRRNPGFGLGLAGMICGIASANLAIPVVICFWFPYVWIYLAVFALLSGTAGIISLILSINGLNKSKNAGFKNKFATAGLITSIIALSVSVAIILLVALLVILLVFVMLIGSGLIMNDLTM